MDVIHNLLNVKKFINYTDEDKIKLKREGRPLPDLSIEQEASSRGKQYKRQFSREVYSKSDWICGCNKKNALFCFPCVIFGGDKSWTQNGVADLKHLSQRMHRHETSRHHLHNIIEYAILGTVNVSEQLDSAYWVNIQKINEEVTKNRYVLSKLIDCVKFCGIFELALRGHDEASSVSDNTGIFRGLINFSAELDKTLAEHLEKSSVFKGTSKEIQNNILDCILEVCRDKILEEVHQSPYLAIMVDETSDVSAKTQLAVILRYSRNGEPIERFWTYLNPISVNAEILSQEIFEFLNTLLPGRESTNKLISQSYDGAAVMTGKYNGVQARIKEKFPYAHLVHCYSHQWNLIMSKAASQNPRVRLFFGNLQEIPAFFKNSPQCIDVLNQLVYKIPHGAPALWNFDINTVNLVFEHWATLIECMEHIEYSFGNQTICSAASSIRRILLDDNFTFWLTFFHRVMPDVDVLFVELQKTKTNPVEVNKKIGDFEESLKSIRNSIPEIVSEASSLLNNPLPTKRVCRNDSDLDNQIAAKEICDLIFTCVEDRFAFKSYYFTANLFDSNKFGEYLNKIPEEILNLTCSAYPGIDKERLKTELSVIYSRADCRSLKGAVPFLKFLIENNLSGPFQETKRILDILITIPMTTAEPERTFSTIRRIKTFLRNSVTEDRLVALSMLSIEKELIRGISNFNENVIDKLASKEENKINLIYKK